MPNTQSIPLFDLNPEIENLWEDLNEAVQEVLLSGQFILGPEVEEFEDEVAEYLGVDHAVGVNSGTDALMIGLRSLGVEPGDEVITTPFTFFATAEAISNIGAEPVFVDIDPETFNLAPNEVEEAITLKTAAILPVHLFGAPAAMAQIMAIAKANDLVVLEDCAQSFGARYEGDCPGCQGEHCDEAYRSSLSGRVTGSIGHAGAFSFFPTKNLGAYGDGGLIATDDPEVAETAQMLRKHGGKNKYHNEVLGYNSRLDALQAAILKVKLPYVDEYNRSRLTIARRYNNLLGECDGVEVPTIMDGHVFHQYTIRVKEGRRNELEEELADQEIGHKVYYPVSCHQLPVYEDHGYHLPQAEQASEEVLSLPMWPQADAEVQERVAKIVKRALT